ncbi:MAG: TetR/AcrR family transcriptional regulator [Sciscionella sp.]
MRQPAGRAQRRNGGERKPREQRWAQLIEVATEVFFEKGYEAASLQDIADRLGMLKGSLYYYIHSKEDLLFDVISEVHRVGLANIESLAEQGDGALERLHNVVVGHLEHECHNLTRTAVFLHELQALPPHRQQAIIGGEHAYRAVFSHLIQDGQREGSVRDDLDPKLAALSVLGSINWVYRWFRPGGEFTPRQIGEQFADMIMRGLASESAWPDAVPRSGPTAARRPQSGPRKTARARTA